MVNKGPLAQYPVVGLKAVVNDGSYHDVDSSDRAFQTTAEGCFREHFIDTKPAILEPIMKIEVECPEQFQGAITGDLISRRGMITSSEVEGKTSKLQAEIPLAETFGYSTSIRSMSQGQGTFTMELLKYAKTPSSIQEEIIGERKKQQLAAAK
jgi:elongation factor G